MRYVSTLQLQLSYLLWHYLLWHYLLWQAVRYVSTLQSQLSYGIMAAQTLTEIFADNEVLLEKAPLHYRYITVTLPLHYRYVRCCSIRSTTTKCSASSTCCASRRASL